MTPFFHRYFSGISLLVRVKIPILRNTLKKPYGKEGCFFKNKTFGLRVKPKMRDYHEI
jgi:hypothetical protein